MSKLRMLSLVFLVLITELPMWSAVTVTISPSTATVNQLATKTFSASVSGSTNTSVTWSVTSSGGGSVSTAGVYTAPATAGTYKVRATSKADTRKYAEATVTVPSVAISVSPTTATLAPGTTQQFSATVTGTANTTVTWTTTGGSISSAGLLTAPSVAGAYSITAKSSADATKSANATVTVSAPITISVNPASATVNQGATQTFTATVTGTTNTAVTWSATGGTINTSGVFTAPAVAGTYTITAKSSANSAKTATATVTVPSVAISVSPTTATVAQGATQAFAVTVTGTTNTAVTWSATGGTINTSGVFTAPAVAGTYTITAKSSADSSKTATATVTVPSVAISVNPTTATVAEGATQAFVATVTGTTNTAVTWSASSGSITTGGLWTAPIVPGSYTITATSKADGRKKATAQATVLAPVEVSVDPVDVTVALGQIQVFNATVTGTANTNVIWSCSGGSITTAGAWTAPMVPGIYTVTATSQADGTKSATTEITVPVSVTVSPASTILDQGATKAFSSLVVGSSDTSVTWSASGGTITDQGVYTAPTQAGTYYIYATSSAQPGGVGAATVTVNPVSITVSPANITISPGASLAYTAVVTGIINKDFVWSTIYGSIDQNGNYMAPSLTGTWAIRATSKGNPNAIGSTGVTVSNSAVIVNFTSDLSTVKAGQTTTLRWSVMNATYLALVDSNNVTQEVTGLTQIDWNAGYHPDGPVKLLAYNSIGATSVYSSINITVIRPVVTSFVVSTTNPKVGENIIFTPSFANGEGKITPDIGKVQSGVGVSAKSMVANTYTLSVTNEYGFVVTNDLVIMPSVVRGKYVSNATMNHPGSYIATNLIDGRIMFAYGNKYSDGKPETAIEFFDPSKGVFNDAVVTTYSTGRDNCTLTVLPSGKVVVWGGKPWGSNGSDSGYMVDIFDPATGNFEATLGYPEWVRCFSQSNVLMFNGQILKTGGLDTTLCTGSEAYHSILFDPYSVNNGNISPKFTTVSGTNFMHFDHKSFLLPNGKVFVCKPDKSEIYDQINGVFSEIQFDTIQNLTLTGERLYSGKIFATYNDLQNQQRIGLFDPEANSIEPINIPTGLGVNLGHGALLPDGKVLFPADNTGMKQSCLFDPESNGFVLSSQMINSSRPSLTVNSLPLNGKVLITGGAGGTELYDPELPFVLSPTSGMVKVGESLSFKATSDGSSLIPAVWSATGGEITTGGVWTAPQVPGFYVISATDGSNNTLKAMITVVKPQTGLPGVLTLEPSAVAIRPRGGFPFHASVTSGLSISMSVDGGGYMDGMAGNLFRAYDLEGVFHLTAKIGDAPSNCATSTITIREDADRDMVIAPQDATIFQGQTVKFSAIRFNGDIAGSNSIIWRVVAADDWNYGTIQDQGNGQAIYTAPSQPGTYTVIALSTDGEPRSITAKVEVKDGRPTINSFTAFPVEVIPGESSMLTWSVADYTSLSLSDGKTSWDVTGKTGWVVQPQGTGSTRYQLVASNAFGVTGTWLYVAVVTTPVTIAVSPKTSNIFAGQSIQFNTVIKAPTTRVTWSCSGGSISSAGLYTAPNTPGTYIITAVSVDDPTKNDTATVNVQAGIRVSMTPASIVLVPGGSVSFTALVTGTDDKSVTWSVLPSEGGQIDGDGKYTAPLVPGTYTVQAVSSADPSQVAHSTIGVTISGKVDVSGVFVVPEDGWGGSLALFPIDKGGVHTVDGYWGGVPTNAFSGTLDGLILSGTRATGEPFSMLFQAGGDQFQGAWSQSAATLFSGVRQVGVVAIFVEPLKATMGPLGFMRFCARVVGTDNPAVSWSSPNGQVDSAGNYIAPLVYSPPTSSSVTVTSVADPSKTVTSSILVTNPPSDPGPDIYAFQVSPSVIPPGGSATLSWLVGRADQVLIEPLTNEGPTLDVTGNPPGPFTTNSIIVNPSQSKRYYMIARNRWRTVRPEADLSVSANQVVLSISPKTASTLIGQTNQFGYSLQAPTNRLTWTARLGTVTTSGLYTAPSAPGTDTVTVRSVDDPTQSDSADVTVKDITLTLVPASVKLSAGQNYQFGCTYEIPKGSSLVWAASGGTISQTGLFVPPPGDGTYTVSVACSYYPDRKQTANVTVTSRFARVIPGLAVVKLGKTYKFSASVDSGSVTWSVVEAGGGTITQGGTYTAPLTEGTYTIKAVSNVDPDVFGTAKVIASKTVGGGTYVGPPEVGNLGTTGARVTLTPGIVQVDAGTHLQFTVSVSGTDNQLVTWKVVGDSKNAQVDGNGLFVASRQGGYQVQATSVADNSASATASVYVISSIHLCDNPLSSISGYSVTGLDNGKVLIAGGFPLNQTNVPVSSSGSYNYVYSNSAWLYDPETQIYAPTGNMHTARGWHYAVKLSSGRVLIAGGSAQWLDPWWVMKWHDEIVPWANGFPFAEEYDPESGSFLALPGGQRPSPTKGDGSLAFPDSPALTGAGMMLSEHPNGMAINLSNGDVMVVGGDGEGWWGRTVSMDAWGIQTSNGVDLYNPGARAFLLGDAPWRADLGFSITGLCNDFWGQAPRSENLSDGRVLVTAGALNDLGFGFQIDRGLDPSVQAAVALVVDPASMSASTTQAMQVPRFAHTLTRLADGRILAVGGKDMRQAQEIGQSGGTQWRWSTTSTAEIYDPATNSWTLTQGNLNQARAYHAAVLLPSGKVLIVGGYNSDLAGNVLYPNDVELFDPSDGSFSVMDNLDYGISSPQLALMNDGSVFVAGQVQAPMNPPTTQQAQPMSMLARPMAANGIGTLPLLVGSTIVGTIQSHWDFQVCPEEAALLFDKQSSSLVAMTTTSSTYGVRPSRARISVPRLGKNNQRQRFFILKIQKPSRNHTIVGVRVVLTAGSQSQVILGDSAPQPLASGVFSRIYSKSDVTYVETDPTELANEQIRKGWLLSWLPDQAPTDGVTEFYKVLVTMDATNPSRIAYGVDASGNPAPPSSTLNYTFRIYYALNGEASTSTPAYFDFPQSATSSVIEAHWSSIPYFAGDSYGPQTSNQWVDQSTFNWVADSTRRGLLEPMFDFSMEHGRNTGHTHAHLNGRQGDMYHPGYTALLGNYVGTSGTAFRDNYLLPTYYAASGWVDKDAKGNVVSTVAPDPTAVSKLASWIIAARSKVQGFMNVDSVGSFGVMNFIYLSTTTLSNSGTSPVVECKEIKDLMIKGSCVGMIVTNSDGSTRNYNALDLTTSALLPPSSLLSPWQINTSLWLGDPSATHTHHLHVQWGAKALQFMSN